MDRKDIESIVFQLIAQVDEHGYGEINMGKHGYLICAFRGTNKGTYSIKIMDAEHCHAITDDAPPDEAVGIASKILPRRIAEAKRKNIGYASPPSIAAIGDERAGINVMAIHPDVTVHRKFGKYETKRQYLVFAGNENPLTVNGEEDLIECCAGYASFDKLEEASHEIYSGKEMLATEVGEERHIVTVKPRTRIFDGDWVATLFVVPGEAFIVGWGSDKLYASLLHDAIVAAAEKTLK